MSADKSVPGVTQQPDRDASRTRALRGALEGHRRWLLFGVLATLHLVIVEGPDTLIGRVLLLGHFGLFLLWQPVIRAETRLGMVQIVSVGAVCIAVVAWASAMVPMVWTMALAGMIGGRAYFYEDRPVRLGYLLALGYLVAMLLTCATPEILPRAGEVPDAVRVLATYVLPLVLPVILFLPEGDRQSVRDEAVDFVYSAFVFLLLAVLVLGALALMQLTGRGYFQALLLALGGVSTVLFVLGWSWNPRESFGGLGLLFSRHALSFGVPFDEWLARMNDLAGREADPQRFLAAACEELVKLPGVLGARWTVGERVAETGRGAATWVRLEHPAATIELATRRDPGPSRRWHYNLMAQIVCEFYLGRVRAQELERMGYVRAVHETGARLTHDVKNLLQSLNTLCYAAGREGEDASREFQALLRRQLPAITRRLEHTLDKLKRPDAEANPLVPATVWWRELRNRFSGDSIRFSMGEEVADKPIPADLFSRAVENLLQNALAKQRGGRELRISVRLETGPRLTVCDDGDPVPQDKVDVLTRAPVASESGLGIGLYHAARQAELHGYRLRLASNQAGQVCFSLEKGPEAVSQASAGERAAPD